MIYGSVLAPFCCQGFGLSRTTKVTRAAIERRVGELEKIVRFYRSTSVALVDKCC